MEQVLRKIVEVVVLMFAYIPMGIASIAFIGCVFVFSKHVVIWIKSGEWLLPKLFESVNMDFLSVLMDDRVSGIRITLIQFASKLAALPTPVFLLLTGILCLCAGLVMLHFARAIKEAGAK